MWESIFTMLKEGHTKCFIRRTLFYVLHSARVFSEQHILCLYWLFEIILCYLLCFRFVRWMSPVAVECCVLTRTIIRLISCCRIGGPIHCKVVAWTSASVCRSYHCRITHHANKNCLNMKSVTPPFFLYIFV